MASKNEYYDRVISALQSDLTSQKSEIGDLKVTITRQQKEIESLKSSQQPQQSPLYSKLSDADKSQLFLKAKKECAAMIYSRLEVLSSHYATKREFDTLQTTITKAYLPTDTFTSYKRSQETRLKSIEEKLNRRLSFFSVNRRKQPPDQTRNASFSITSIIQFFKRHNPQWLIRIFVSLFISLLAVYMIRSIR